MTRLLAMLVLLIGVAGCKPDAVRTDPAPPVAAGCSSLCETPCVGADGDTGIRWDGSPVDAAAWDALADRTTFLLADALRQCETHRRACAQCLDNLREQGVIQ